MKKALFTLLIVLPTWLAAQNATIKIDIERSIGEIDPRIYGVFMEPIQFSGKRFGLPDSVQFNTLYGTLYDPSSPLADENGFKKNYLEAMKELKITNMRWPGGNFLMGYNWQDGIGHKEPVFINVVNRHKEKAITADIVTTTGNFAGKTEASLIAGTSLNEVYEFDKQDQYVPVKKMVDARGKQLTYTFPPHSFTQIKTAIIAK
jgi:alpha-L-arabinofuranosidase